MEGLTETGAPNPFICVRPRKREEWGRGGMGLQNATALSPLQTRPPQPSEHETHLMWSMHSSGRIHTHAHTEEGGWDTHLRIYSMLTCLLKRTQHTVVNTAASCSHAHVRATCAARRDRRFRVRTCLRRSMRLSASAWTAVSRRFSLG